MPSLLDYVIRSYQNGGEVDYTTPTNYDVFSTPSKESLLDQYNIWINPESRNLLPDYDPTSQNLFHDAFGLRKQALQAGLSEATAGGRQGLMDLTRQGQQQAGSSLFQGHGGISRAMSQAKEAARKSYGEISSDFGRREEQAYLDLQQDIFGLGRGYEKEFMQAVGDLPEDEWGFGDKPTGGTGQQGGACYGGESCAEGLVPEMYGGLNNDAWCRCVEPEGGDDVNGGDDGDDGDEFPWIGDEDQWQPCQPPEGGCGGWSSWNWYTCSCEI